MGDSILEARGIVKRYGDKMALSGVDLTVRRGESVALVGPNGAGKSTLMRIVFGILSADRGSITVAGQRSSPATRALMGYVPQSLALYPSLSARENLELFARLFGTPSHQRREAVARLLGTAGLEASADRPLVRGFSAGMAQRLHVVSAFVHSPAIVLLDEPTAGVDVQSRARIYEMVEEYHRGGGTVVLTTHMLEECERLCHRIYLIDRGAVLCEGKLADVVAQHGTLERAFISLTGRELRD